mgnify:CR=1 FL=1
MVQHSALVGDEVHEPKGIETASFGQVYVSTGDGTGAWYLFTDIILNANLDVTNVTFTDISTAEDIYIPMPFACDIDLITVCLQGAITTANATVQAYDNLGNSMGSVSIPFSGSAAGQLFTITPTSNNSIPNNSFMKISTDGASSGVAKAVVRVDYNYVYA